MTGWSFGQVTPPAATQPAPSPVSLAGDARQTQYATALSDAADNLRQQVRQTALTRSLTAGDWVDRCDAAAALNALLQDAKPIGGPRWIDDRTCQIRLQLPAVPVAVLLEQLAVDHPNESPVSADMLRRRLRYWDRLTFFAVGSSTVADAVAQARPVAALGTWADVGDDTRRQVLADARLDAVVHLTADLAPIPLPPSPLHLSDALGREPIRDRLGKLLSHEAVTHVSFLDNLHAQVTLAPGPRSLVADVFQALDADPAWLSPTSVDWPRVEQFVTARIADGRPWVAVGDAAAPVSSTASTQPLLSVSPDWIDRQLFAESVAGGHGISAPPLRLARTAQAAALDKIRAQLLALPLNGRGTVGDAARSAVGVDAAVDRSMRCVHVSNVECRADGSVRVQATLNLRDVWDALGTTP